MWEDKSIRFKKNSKWLKSVEFNYGAIYELGLIQSQHLYNLECKTL